MCAKQVCPLIHRFVSKPGSSEELEEEAGEEGGEEEAGEEGGGKENEEVENMVTALKGTDID